MAFSSSLTHRILVLALAALAYLAGIPGQARAGTLWNESISGDLSNNHTAPTSTTVSAGSNLLRATSGGFPTDREYFKLVVPAGAQLTHIFLTDFSTVFDGKAFIGVQAGPQITMDPFATDPSLLLGYAHFGPHVEPLFPVVDLLPSIGTGVGSIGFTGPLGPGEYTFWTQQTSASSPSTYELDFVIETLPAPDDVPIPGWALFAQAALVAVLGMQRIARAKQV